ncbi:hypothetical protein ACIBL3_45425, partial [Kribbella sp. NPDC050124]|uniref:hypothetical protein n=1 Tax=Kribbella sp. NPDC050124 TaxID=3364114 RepID=UPI0037A8351A
DRMDDMRTTDDRMDDMRTTDDRMDDMRTTDDRMDDMRTTDDRTGDMGTSGGPRGVEWTASDGTQPLLAEDRVVDFRTRWEVIQQGFVDDPRQSVSEADRLVDEVLKRLSMSFEEQHQGLEKQWSDGEPSTEDLRAALQKYRAFFQRLLAM